MKLTALVLLGLAVQTQAAFTFYSSFTPDFLPLTQAEGSFVGDIYQHPTYQEIGGFGLATASGLALSDTFTPVDFTQGTGRFGNWSETQTVPNPSYDPNAPPGPFNPETIEQTINFSVHLSLFLVAAKGESTEPWRVTLYDNASGSSHWDITPTGSAGQFKVYSANEASFVGNVDWTAVDQFSIGGTGGNGRFHAAFDLLGTVPEPQSISLAVGVGLIGWAFARLKMRRVRA